MEIGHSYYFTAGLCALLIFLLYPSIARLYSGKLATQAEHYLRRLALTVLLPYLYLVLGSTVLSRTPTEHARYKLQVFWTYLEIFKGDGTNGRAHFLLTEAWLNMMMLMPIGLFMPFICTKRKTLASIGFAFLFSCTIEIAQLLTHRGLFEFDDIIHNTLGAAMAYGFYCLCVAFFTAVFQTKPQPLPERPSVQL